MKKSYFVFVSLILLSMALNGCGGLLTGEDSQGGVSDVGTLPVNIDEISDSETEGTDIGETSNAENRVADMEGNSNTETGISDKEENNDLASLYGTWEVKDYQVQVGTVYELSTEDMESFRGIKITYQSDSIMLDGGQVADGNFTYKTGAAYNYDSLTDTYGANLGDWWNNISEVTNITVESEESFFGNQFFTVDSETIWINYKDVFFLARKTEQ